MIQFDWTISLGTIAAVVAILLTILRLHHSNIARMTRLETKLDIIFDWWTERNRRRSSRHDDPNE